MQTIVLHFNNYEHGEFYALYEKSFITVNSEIFARIYFREKALSHICDVKNSRLEHGLPISVNNSDCAKSRGFCFHETSHMRSFAKIKTLRKFPNLQYPGPA